MTGSRATTRGIAVTVEPRFLPEKSQPHLGRWLFAYSIRIDNLGIEAVQLLTRHWIITDANGRIEEVRGAGVIGQQPILEPGESHEYTSFCPLPTAFGTMEGSYRMATAAGEQFDVEVARFELSQPMAVN
jgi:ApaG protein